MYLRNLNKRSFLIIAIFLFVVAFSFMFKVSATPPATPYNPGETLNPTCGPTDTNCTVSIGSSGWGLTGNAGTVDGTNFIGTTDNIPLTFKVNSQKAGRIDSILNNTFFGFMAGNNNTTGTKNIANGGFSLQSNTSGIFNTAIGYNALNSNSAGNNNTATGGGSLFYNLASNNVAIGNGALLSTINGGNNVAIGYQAGYYETTSNNLFIDNQQRASEADGRVKSLIYGKFDTSTANQFVNINGTLGILDASGAYYTKLKGGTQTADVTYTLPGAQGGASTVLTNDGTGVLSWATGGGSGWGLTGNTGTIDGTNFIGTTDNIPLTFKVNNQKAGRIDNNLSNVFLGYQAGNANTTGYNNTVIGDSAFIVNTTGRRNVAIGTSALSSNTDGSQNFAVGEYALSNNTTGSDNTAFGHNALLNNTIGQANAAVGDSSLSANTTGSNNVGVGLFSLFSDSTGSNNVAVGNFAGYYETDSNSLYIDNQQRSGESDAKIKALIYGKFGTDSTNQFLTINGKLNVNGGMNISSLPTSASGLISGDLWNNVGVVNIVP